MLELLLLFNGRAVQARKSLRDSVRNRKELLSIVPGHISSLNSLERLDDFLDLAAVLQVEDIVPLEPPGGLQ